MQWTTDVVDGESGTICKGVASFEEVEGGEDLGGGGVLRWGDNK